MSFIVGRAGCFAISDQPTLDEATIAKIANGIAVQAHFAYHIGVRIELWRDCLAILIFFSVKMISVRCHLSFAITLAEPSIY
jgi:hypothetical protein